MRPAPGLLLSATVAGTRRPVAASNPTMRCASIAVLATLAAFSIACSSAPGPNPGGAVLSPRATATAKPTPFPGAEWATVRWTPYDSLVHGFSMPLPEDMAWKVDDVKDAWFVATHAASNTQVVARTITTDGLANRARCEARARNLRPLPEREGASIVERRRIDLPSGFDTIVEVGLLPTNPGQPITGYILAIGGWSKRCFAYALTTSAKGPGADEAVGDRLALFMQRSFQRLKFVSDLTPLVPRERPPLGP